MIDRGKQDEIIDSHQHFWKIARADYGWLSPYLSVLYQDYLPSDYLRATKGLGVTQSVLIQAADTVDETEFLLQIALETPFVAGVVGWIDMESHKALEQLQSFSRNPYFKGIRPMLQDIEDINWIMSPAFDPIFRDLAEKGLSFDALIKGEHIPHILTIAEKNRSLKIVIDHCAKPDIAANGYEKWAKDIAVFKRFPNVYLKFSGLTTEARGGDANIATYQPYFDHAVSIFGMSRILWGSDWPVIKLNSEYEVWQGICQKLVQNFSHDDQRKFWSENSRFVYNLDRRQE